MRAFWQSMASSRPDSAMPCAAASACAPAPGRCQHAPPLHDVKYAAVSARVVSWPALAGGGWLYL